MRDVVRLTMGKLYEQADSLGAAGEAYGEAGRTASDQAVAEEAAYRSLGLLLRLNAADSAACQRNTVSRGVPRERARGRDPLEARGPGDDREETPPGCGVSTKKLTGEFGYTTLAVLASGKAR